MIKKIMTAFLAVFMLASLFAFGAAAEEAPKSTVRKYMEAYTPGLSEEAMKEIDKLVSEYGAEGGGPAGSGAVWRCIREIGTAMGYEVKSNVDMVAGTMSLELIKAGEPKFKNVSKEVQDIVVAKIKEAAAAINLTADYADGKVVIKKADATRLTLQLLDPAPVKSTVRKYMEAYTPGLSEEAMKEIDKLVSEYGAEGGGPAGSGAVWRCIREIGTAMGYEVKSNVDMVAGTMSLELIKAGEPKFKNVSKEVQDIVVAKIKEAAAAINLTADYADGKVVIKKADATRLTLQLLEPVVVNPPVTPVEKPETTESETDKSGDDTNPKTGDSSFVLVPVLFAAVSLAVVMKKRAKAV